MIEGSLVSETRGFGSALASSQDVDGNGIHGNYDSQLVVINIARYFCQLRLRIIFLFLQILLLGLITLKMSFS